MRGLIFDIQRFSTHDGPGIRTTVFLKGCPLRCFWCHNPESMSRKAELFFRAGLCIGCGKCERVCRSGAISLSEGKAGLARERCVSCGSCAAVCPSKALIMSGRQASEEEIIAEIRKDTDFYHRSGGGVTFSGGEPLCQSEFLESTLKACKAEGINTAVDTAGETDFSDFERVAPYCDLFLFDIKSAVEETHIRGTGRPNGRILDNLARLCAAGAAVSVRIPVIPGFNDSVYEMESIARALERMAGIKSVELLPFHRMGSVKYEYLGAAYPAAGLQPPAPEKMKAFAEIIAKACPDVSWG